MKRMTFAAIAAALLASIAFAEAIPQAEAETSPTAAKRYLPSGSDATGGFAAGAFTLPPS